MNADRSLAKLRHAAPSYLREEIYDDDLSSAQRMPMIHTAIMATVIVDHLFRPYCSGYRRARQIERCFSNVEVRSFDACKLMEEEFRIIPSHIADAVLAGEPRSVGAAFFVNGQLVARGPGAEALDGVIERAGGERAADSAVWHSPFSQLADAPPGIHVNRIIENDILEKQPLPVFWCELSPADTECRQFLLDLTRKHGGILACAYVDGLPAGFVTFLPGEECDCLPPRAERCSDALRIVCLHVLPRHRRSGVASALIKEVMQIAEERGKSRVVVHAGWRDIDDRFSGACAGSKSPYLKLGFRLVSGSEPSPMNPNDYGRANLEYWLSGES